jgi:hypothetical protein
MAYDEARERARSCRNKQDGQGERLWSRVAVTIAKRTGREIGVKAADRYQLELTREGRALARDRHDLTLAARSVLAGLSEIARGRNVEPELHNIRAHVRNAEAFVARDVEIAAAGAEVVRAAARLAAVAERAGGLIEQGCCPPEPEIAGLAVERWRSALLRAARRSRGR